MKNSLASLYEKEATKKVLASLISILIGLLVGAVVVTIVGLTKKTIGLAGLWDGIRIVFVGIFCKGRDAAGALEWGFNGRTVGNMLFRATPIIMTGLSVALDENYVKSLAGAMDPDGSLGYAQAADAFLQVLDNLGIYVVEEGDLAHVSVELNETVIANLTAAADDTGVSVVSSLFPHYAIRAEGVSFSDMLIPSYTINDQSFTQEEMTAMLQQLSAVVAPYWEDALAISAQIQGAVNEDGSATSVITTKNVAALWSAWSTRLSTDAAMQGILQSVLELVNEGQPEQLTLPELMQSVQSAVDELNAQEENVMAAVTVYEDEAAGSQHVILNAMDSLQLQLSSYVNENNHACMDITLMTNSSESGEAESWEDI